MPRTPITRYSCDHDGCSAASDAPQGWFVVVPGADPGVMMIVQAPEYERMIAQPGNSVESWVCGAECMLDYVRAFAGVPVVARASA